VYVCEDRLKYWPKQLTGPLGGCGSENPVIHAHIGWRTSALRLPIGPVKRRLRNPKNQRVFGMSIGCRLNNIQALRELQAVRQGQISKHISIGRAGSPWEATIALTTKNTSLGKSLSSQPDGRRQKTPNGPCGSPSPDGGHQTGCLFQETGSRRSAGCDFRSKSGNERSEKGFGFAGQADDFTHCRSKPQAVNSAVRTSGQRSPDRLHNTAPKRSRWPNEM
jgi:hypothetical protein